jgi:DNA primase
MSNWVDFAAIKQSVPLAPLLRHYEVRLRRSGRDQYRGRCPIHQGEGRDAFHANLSKNVFHCFSCGAGGTVLDFVAAMEGCTLREAALKVVGEVAPAGNPRSTAGASQLVTEKRRAPAPLGFRLHDVNTAHSYLAARGIERRTAEEFGVGVYHGPGLFTGRLVIPIHNERGELIAYCGRALDGSEPRYRFPPGFAKSEILFNLHRAVAAEDPAVVVVEGFFDCLKVYQAGIHSVVALMGAALYTSQRTALLQRFRRVVLLLDGDPAGRRATTEIAARLRSHASVQTIHLAAQRQPDQFSSEAIRQLLEPALSQAG